MLFRSADVNQYVVSTSFGTQIFPGDMMVVTSSQGFIVPYTSGAGFIIGVAAGGTSAASLSSAVRIPIYDNPDQVFVVQLTTLTSTLVGLGTNIATSVAGSTAINRSAMMVGSVAPVIGSTAPLRCIGVHPIENIDGTTGVPANSKVLVRITQHALSGQLTT